MTTGAEKATDNRQDNYALDDTLTGRITQAAAAGIVTSYPDWIKSRRGRIAAYVLSFFGFGALVAYTNAQAEEEDSAEPGTFEPVTGAEAPGAWAVSAAVVLAGVLSTWLGTAVSRRVVRGLRKRGFAKPWTVLGIVAAAVVYSTSELEARRIEKLAQ